jgi:hypothetical protein
MFQYYAEDSSRFTGTLDLTLVRELNPDLQSFETWLKEEQRAYPIRIAVPPVSGSAAVTVGPCFQVVPACVSAGTPTASCSRSWGTRMKRAVWCFAAVLPPGYGTRSRPGFAELSQLTNCERPGLGV